MKAVQISKVGGCLELLIAKFLVPSRVRTRATGMRGGAVIRHLLHNGWA